MSREYRNKTEHKLAKEKVQEIVDFLGYHADPDFRDVRGKDHPGKDPGTGSFRVYVGSASHKSDLIPVRDKLTALVWKGSKPFQQATVRLIERVASPSAKEASHER